MYIQSESFYLEKENDMKKRTHCTWLIIVLFMISNTSFAQKNYWQQKVDFKIDVTLDPTLKTLNAFERLTYTNNSPDTLKFIWFHLWPNAYKNDRTAFSEQMLRIGRTDFYFSQNEKRGYINRLDFRVNDQTLKQKIIRNILISSKSGYPNPYHPKNQ